MKTLSAVVALVALFSAITLSHAIENPREAALRQKYAEMAGGPLSAKGGVTSGGGGNNPLAICIKNYVGIADLNVNYLSCIGLENESDKVCVVAELGKGYNESDTIQRCGLN